MGNISNKIKLFHLK